MCTAYVPCVGPWGKLPCASGTQEHAGAGARTPVRVPRYGCGRLRHSVAFRVNTGDQRSDERRERPEDSKALAERARNLAADQHVGLEWLAGRRLAPARVARREAPSPLRRAVRVGLAKGCSSGRGSNVQ